MDRAYTIEPRYLIFSRSAPHPAFLPGTFVHRVEVTHDSKSPRPLRGRLHFKGFAVYDDANSRLLRLFVYQEPGHALLE